MFPFVISIGSSRTLFLAREFFARAWFQSFINLPSYTSHTHGRLMYIIDTYVHTYTHTRARTVYVRHECKATQLEGYRRNKRFCIPHSAFLRLFFNSFNSDYLGSIFPSRERKSKQSVSKRTSFKNWLCLSFPSADRKNRFEMKVNRVREQNREIQCIEANSVND